MSKDEDPEVFAQYGAYYDLLYRDKNYEAEAGYVARELQAAAPRAKSILELGSGTGKHGRLLAARGFDVLGVERSAAMVSIAAAAPAPAGGGEFACVQGDIRDVVLERRFDAAISLFHVISYLSNNSDVQGAFRNTARQLRPGGAFLFDVWHGPAVLAQRPSVRIKRMENEDYRLTRLAEPDMDAEAGVVTVRYTFFIEPKSGGRLVTFRENHRMRYFFPTEVRLLAEAAGFAVEKSEEFLTGGRPGESTWGVAYLLRKPA